MLRQLSNSMHCSGNSYGLSSGSTQAVCAHVESSHVASLLCEKGVWCGKKWNLCKENKTKYDGICLIVGSLMVCWLPYQIRRLMTAVPKSRWTTSYFRSYVTLHPVADSFFYLSSVINPFLYNLSSRQFREVFVQVLRCRLTLEHINKRTRNFPPTFTTFHSQSDSGVASNTQTSLSLTEASDLQTKTDVPSETEV
ncbi:hypothetical protein KUCAC02_009923 [Chaenocephalus aceratus]|uniref:Uncharacterized protein n=1 Tax=Chaenocephalus aceratus TaxID=36190 RepID=A0ACB9VY90_CHAAC|nr:hypothetical protein KUCAC02_009923 [Chaenocephalus aceratus]